MSIHASAKRPLALIVEDDPFQMRFGVVALEQAGFRVHALADGDDVVAQATTLQPALVLLDIVLPNVGGFEVCEMLKASPATSHIPIMVMSARRSPMDRAHAEMAGADDYLVKPVNPVALAVHARALVSRATAKVG
jgi:DNA-binding response OmpR family regulator